MSEIFVIQNQIDDCCRSIYRQAHDFYSKIRPTVMDADGHPGYEILYGPTTFQAPILFLGMQPGGRNGQNDMPIEGAANPWPSKTCYATATWPLAVKLKTIFPEKLLETCTGLNAIFVRSRNKKQYLQLPLTVRQEIEKFCLPQTEKIVELLEPKKIVVIGLETLGKFGESEEVAPRESKRGSLIRKGFIGKRAATAVCHLTGAWLTAGERETIKEHLTSMP